MTDDTEVADVHAGLIEQMKTVTDDLTICKGPEFVTAFAVLWLAAEIRVASDRIVEHLDALKNALPGD